MGIGGLHDRIVSPMGLLHVGEGVKIARMAGQVPLIRSAIIIGHQGVALKKVSTEARKSLEKFFGKSVYLEIFVKVDKDWRSSERELNHFGYNPE